MKKKLLRSMSILCTAALLSVLPYSSNLRNVQADSELIGEISKDEVFEDNSLVSKDGRFRYRMINRDNTVAILGYIGEDANIKVPTKIDGKKVSQVGLSGELTEDIDYMSNNEFVKQITFPEGITIYSPLASNAEKISIYSSKEKSDKQIITHINIKRCTNLKEADLRQASHLTSCSFSDCTSLKTIYLPSLMQDTDLYFHGCTNLKDVYYDDTESSWARVMGVCIPDEFKNEFNATIDNKELYKAKKHFKAKKSPYGGYESGSFDSYGSINTYSAEQRSNPTKECTFFLPRDKKTIKIPDTVVLYKGGNPVKVTAICGNPLETNNTATNVMIGKNVTAIQNDGFRNWSKLKKITIKSTKLITIKSTHVECRFSDYQFEGIHPNAVIKVPKKQLSAYKALFGNLKVKVTA